MKRDEEGRSRRRGSTRKVSNKPYNDDYRYAEEDDFYEEDSYYEESGRGRRDRYYEDDRRVREDRRRSADDRYYEEHRRGGDDRYYEDRRRSGDDRYGENRRRSSEDRYYEDRRRGGEDRYYEDRRRSSEDRYYEDRRRSGEDRYGDTRRRSEDDRYVENRRRGDSSYSERNQEGYGQDSRNSRRESNYQEEPRRERRSEGKSHGKKKNKGCGGCLFTFLIILIASIAGIWLLISSLWARVDSAKFGDSDIAINEDLPSSVKKSTKDYRTIMIFGVDSRDNTTLQEGTLADSNIIVSIHKKTGEMKLLSIYRDTYVETLEGDHMKLTEVYNKYGAKEQLQTINRNFDMNVTEYVTVNWAAVAKTINELGGLDLEISEGEAAGINKYIDEVIDSTGIDSSHVEVREGEHHLDGVQAVTYCRLRKGLGDDYKRAERQRTIISLTLSKAKKAGIPKVLAVCSQVFPSISSSLSMTEVATLALGMGRFNIGESSGFPFDKASQDGGRYFLYPVTLASNNGKLHAYLYGNEDYEPSDTVRGISSHISDVSGYYGN